MSFLATAAVSKGPAFPSRTIGTPAAMLPKQVAKEGHNNKGTGYDDPNKISNTACPR
jgi:hypothetical protein